MPSSVNSAASRRRAAAFSGAPSPRQGPATPWRPLGSAAAGSAHGWAGAQSGSGASTRSTTRARISSWSASSHPDVRQSGDLVCDQPSVAATRTRRPACPVVALDARPPPAATGGPLLPGTAATVAISSKKPTPRRTRPPRFLGGPVGYPRTPRTRKEPPIQPAPHLQFLAEPIGPPQASPLPRRPPRSLGVTPVQSGVWRGGETGPPSPLDRTRCRPAGQPGCATPGRALGLPAGRRSGPRSC